MLTKGLRMNILRRLAGTLDLLNILLSLHSQSVNLHLQIADKLAK